MSKPKGWSGKDWGSAVAADVSLADVSLKDAKADDFDALLLPGGVYNPDALRMIPEAVAFVKSFLDAGKPVAAICHGPWTFLEAGGARRKRMTSWPSLKTDLKNEGAARITRIHTHVVHRTADHHFFDPVTVQNGLSSVSRNELT